MSWYGYDYAPPLPVKNGIKLKKKRGEITDKWWSAKWIKLLESFGWENRLERGKRYARKGQVISIKFKTEKKHTAVFALVQGSEDEPYEVRIKLKRFGKDKWERILEILAKKAIFAAKLLAGEMPKDIETAFKQANLRLFPKSPFELTTSCSCPDWVNPCKHIAAVYYILAEKFDEDPFLLFLFRGMSKESIISNLRKKRSLEIKQTSNNEIENKIVSATGIEKEIENKIGINKEDFWGDIKKISGLNTEIKEPKSPKMFCDAPFSNEKEIVSILQKCYKKISAQTLKLAYS